MECADYLLRSSAVFTGNELEPFAGSVAIRGNEIIAVGDEEEVGSVCGGSTRIVECGDRLIMPGFIDAHMHFPLASVQNDPDFCIFLMDTKSEEECVERVRAFAESHPGDGWIYGCGWYSQVWDNPVDPTKESLDALGLDRPVCLSDFSMHCAWCNSVALDLVGLTPDTPQPEGGVIRHDADGNLTGLLDEPPATDYVLNRVLDVPDLKASLKKSLRRFAQLGITGIGDMFPRGVTCNNVYETYQELADEGDLTMRIAFFPDLEDIAEAKRLRSEYHSDFVRCGGVKIILDGCIEAHTAYMKEPYLDTDDPSFVSEPSVSPEHLKALVRQADAAGLPVRVHAIGNATASLALDAFVEAIEANGFKGLRHAIEHTDTLCFEDIARMNRLGIAAAVQPQHPIGGLGLGIFEASIGPDLTAKMWRYREELDGGVHLGFSTDWPAVMSINPLDTIYAAVTRCEFDGTPEGGYFPEMAVTLGEALQCHTQGSAYVDGMESCVGTLEPGKLADLIVLDRNLFACDPLEVRKAQIELTMVDGAVVYAADGFEIK